MILYFTFSFLCLTTNQISTRGLNGFPSHGGTYWINLPLSALWGAPPSLLFPLHISSFLHSQSFCYHILSIFISMNFLNQCPNIPYITIELTCFVHIEMDSTLTITLKNICFSCYWPNSLKNFFIHNISLRVSVIAIHSNFVIDKATHLCSLDYHDIASFE